VINMVKVISQTGNMPIEPIRTRASCQRCASGCRTICTRGNFMNCDVKDGDFEGFEIKFAVPDYGTFKKNKKAK
jgi:hypothetical protein